MDMERFKEELARAAGPHGEKAWSIVETWYTRDGRSRRLSLHDLHELSKAIADALKDVAPEPDTRGPDIDEMVSRFLAWRLPEDFYPDCGISYSQISPTSHPTGTNLLTAVQARKMIEYITRRAEVESRMGGKA